mmetsp:Transcript_16548/g.39628  ORF Transcript_16548/g.39628 Transcript_16548/m.39628 type:complete len:471 (-) Transcript_16548:264-1676(-)
MFFRRDRLGRQFQRRPYLVPYPGKQLSQHLQPLPRLLRLMDVTSVGVGVARAVHDLLVAANELARGGHRPERVVKCRVQIGYPSVRPDEAIPSHQHLISADDLLPNEFVWYHLIQQCRALVHPLRRDVYPNRALPIQVRRGVPAVSSIHPGELRGIERIEHRRAVQQDDFFVPDHVQHRVHALVMGGSLGIDFVLVLPEGLLGEVSFEPQVVGREGHHDCGSVFPHIDEMFDPWTVGLAKYDHRIGGRQELPRGFLVHFHRMLGTHLIKRGDNRGSRSSDVLGIISGRAAFAIVQLFLRQHIRIAVILGQKLMVGIGRTTPRRHSQNRRVRRDDTPMNPPIPLRKLRRQVFRQQRIPPQVRFHQPAISPFHGFAHGVDPTLGTQVHRCEGGLVPRTGRHVREHAVASGPVHVRLEVVHGRMLIRRAEVSSGEARAGGTFSRQWDRRDAVLGKMSQEGWLIIGIRGGRGHG